MKNRKNWITLGATTLVCVATVIIGLVWQPIRVSDTKERPGWHAALSPWDGTHRELVRRVRESLGDPGSFSHVETFFRDTELGLHVTMRYRAANQFGGMQIYQANAFICPETGAILRVWLR